MWGPDRRADGPLDARDVEAFDEKGYVVVDGLFHAHEVDSLDRSLTALLTADDAAPPEWTVREPGSGEVRSVFSFHRHAGPDPDGALGSVPGDPRLAGAARQILDSAVTVHQSRVNAKPAFRGRDFPWHSDFETWHTEDGMPRMRCLSAVVALTDNHPWNGSLLVMPGSHRTFATTPAETPDDNHEQSLREQVVGVPDTDQLTELYEACGIEQCTGTAGSVLFFDCNLMHGSSTNISPVDRRNLFLVYNSAENALEDPFAAARPRPGHLADRSGHVV